MDVVGDGEAVARLGAAGGGIKDALEVVLGDLDVGQLVVVVGVEVEVGHDVTEIPHDGLAGVVAGRVGRAHVGRVLSDNVADGHFVLDHLVIALGIGDNAEILVRPGVGGDLVTLCNHAADDICPRSSGVDGALSNIDSGHEESGLEAIRRELIKHSVSVDVWAIVICDGNSARCLAGVDATSSICDVALLGSWIITSAGTCRCLVRIACRAEINLTIRGLAMILGGTAVSLSGAAEPLVAGGASKIGAAAAVLTALASLEQTTLGLGDVSRDTSSDRSPRLQVSGKAKELRGTGDISMGSHKRRHNRCDEDVGKAHRRLNSKSAI